MRNLYVAFLVSLVSFLVSWLVYPWVLRYAVRHRIVDNPNARKLQRVPVPVMGGIVVYAGILAGCAALIPFLQNIALYWIVLAMTGMMAIGIWDDVRNLSAKVRFLLEFGLVGLFMLRTNIYINDFHGLFGLHQLSDWVAIPLSLVAGVGIINAVNLIDGVDGYTAGYGMLACGCFAVLFMTIWRPVWVCMAVAVFASLLPFFLHNVFGKKTKMFFGDGGTLMLGALLAFYVFGILWERSRCNVLEQQNVGLIALTLAVLCIPVFDTLRVMTMRMLRGRSPFKPDKTHLHHLFIDMGFSHLGAAAFLLFINLSIILLWLLLWLLGASIDVQTIAVLLMGLSATFGFYVFMRRQQRGGPLGVKGRPKGTWVWHRFCYLGYLSHHLELGRGWKFLRWMVDRDAHWIK